MQHFSITPREMVASLWRNRSLARALIKREVVGRYRGSVLGILWSFFNPVFMLAIYTFFFSVVFKARWHTNSDSKTEFAIVLFAGMLVFNLFAETTNRSPGLILSNINYVKKVVFPLEILPWISVGSALFHALVSLGAWLVFYTLIFGVPHATALLFPLIVLPLILFTLGLSWFLASLGVYLRDVGQIVGIVTTALMFLTPIFYQVTSLPAEYQRFLLLNPLTPAVQQAREVLIWGHVPGIGHFVAYFLVSLFVAWLGFAWFQKTRKGFADVL